MDALQQHKANVDKLTQLFNEMESQYPDSLYIVEVHLKKVFTPASWGSVYIAPQQTVAASYLGHYSSAGKVFRVEKNGRNAVAWSVTEMRARINALAPLIDSYDLLFTEVEDIDIFCSSSPHIDSLAFIN